MVNTVTLAIQIGSITPCKAEMAGTTEYRSEMTAIRVGLLKCWWKTLPPQRRRSRLNPAPDSTYHVGVAAQDSGLSTCAALTPMATGSYAAPMLLRRHGAPQ